MTRYYAVKIEGRRHDLGIYSTGRDVAHAAQAVVEALKVDVSIDADVIGRAVDRSQDPIALGTSGGTPVLLYIVC